MYKLSTFNKIWPIDNDTNMIFNSVSKTTLKVSNKMLNHLHQGDWDKINEATIQFLLNSYILIHEELNSEDIYKFELTTMNAEKETLGIFLVPSRKCNLACTYCIQNNLFENKDSLEITPDVIDGYFNWIQEKIAMWGTQKIDIIFYGGEPLTTNKEILYYLFDKFNQLDLKPNYRVITNGVNLMNYSYIFPYIKSFQITLDGKKDAHDTRRIFKDGRGSYDIILSNIKEYLSLSKSYSVIIRMNVDKDNRDNLLDDLIEITNQLPMDQIEVSLNPVDPYTEDIDDESIHGDIGLTAKSICDCQEYISSTYNKEPKLWALNCGISSLCQWSFDTEGSIYKCSAHTGSPERAVTTIYQKNMNSSFYKLVNRKISSDCMKCCYIGLCNGGCPRQEEILHHVSCKKDFFNEYIPRIIQIKHKIKSHNALI
ncbi:MAG: 4Fe-4S cluster-binding domain-containing protein [Clostridium sp.]|uniref:radical SAM/SPASM domain-containing protein n=1 Tax=Clostridium sp. TaxID=1506 RepID=UPI003068088F